MNRYNDLAAEAPVRANVVGLMRFIHELRGEFFETAALLGPKEFTRDRGVSLGSFRNLFLHLAYVEEHHITFFCQGRAEVWPYLSTQVSTRRYPTIESVRERLRAVTVFANGYLATWNDERDLRHVVRWVRLGHPLKVTRETALAQCATEQLLHLGEVEAMLWQRKVTPPTTLWIDRVFLKGRSPAPPPVRSMKKAARNPTTLLSEHTRANSKRKS
jgi:uncharacterized damage-inducible protein DinB